MLLLQLPGISGQTPRGSLSCSCCNCLGLVNKQPVVSCHDAVASMQEQPNEQPGAPCHKAVNCVGKVIESQRLHFVLLLQLPGFSLSTAKGSLPYNCCNFQGRVINSQELLSMPLLQLHGNSRSKARGFLSCCCCNCLILVNCLGKVINSQVLPSILLLQLPGII